MGEAQQDHKWVAESLVVEADGPRGLTLFEAWVQGPRAAQKCGHAHRQRRHAERCERRLQGAWRSKGWKVVTGR